MNLRRLLAGLSLACVLAIAAHAATLLPLGRQTFLDTNGKPLAGGTVTFYIPNTSSLKDTWQDSGQTTLNTNPVVLDASGSAVIYGSGAYRQVVKTSAGVTIWDKLTSDTSASATSYAGTSGGTANLQTVTAPNFTSGDGQSITFIASGTNTGAFSLNVNGSGGISVLNDTPNGSSALTGGEVVAGNVVTVVYAAGAGVFHTSISPSAEPVGVIKEYAGSTAPAGYLLAYGQCVSRTTYAKLFAVIGTTYGTCDGSTTFGIPDKRGRVGVGLDNMGGVASGRVSSIVALASLGGVGGEQQHLLTTAELPASGLSVTVSYPAHTYLYPQFSAPALAPGAVSVNQYTGASTSLSTTPPSPQSFTTANMGSGSAHNVVQPSIALTYIIKF